MPNLKQPDSLQPPVCSTLLPKALLRHISEALSLPGTSIATLRSIYKRRETLYDHQKWARLQANLELPDPSSDAELRRALAEYAKDAASVQELVNHAMHCLCDRKVVSDQLTTPYRHGMN